MAPPPAHTRVERVAELLKRELAGVLQRKVKDPRLQQCVVSRVRMSNDLRVAWIGLSIFGLEEAEVLKALKRAGGYLRREVASRLDLRHSPEFRFEIDRGPKQLMEMAQLLQGLDMSPDEDE